MRRAARRTTLCLAACALLLGACGGTSKPASTTTPSPRPTATPTLTPTPTPTTTLAPTPLPTNTPPPRASTAGAARVIWHGDPDRRAVTLTFDAGSDTGFAAQILDTLQANGIAAAFGVTGEWAQRNPDLLQRIHHEGHTIINHSYDHASFTGLSTHRRPLTQAQRWYEIDRTETAINDLTGGTTKPYFRPPYGDLDDTVNEDVFAHGYIYNVMWTVDSEGWRGRSADEIVYICLVEVKPGAILIFHVGSASQDANALQRVIDGLRDRGYGFVSLPELIGP